jgi:hypothetical protein
MDITVGRGPARKARPSVDLLDRPNRAARRKPAPREPWKLQCGLFPLPKKSRLRRRSRRTVRLDSLREGELQVLDRLGVAEPIALRPIAAGCADQIELRLCLDAFGDD